MRPASGPVSARRRANLSRQNLRCAGNGAHANFSTKATRNPDGGYEWARARARTFILDFSTRRLMCSFSLLLAESVLHITSFFRQNCLSRYFFVIADSFNEKTVSDEWRYEMMSNTNVDIVRMMS